MTTENTTDLVEDFPGLQGDALALARLTPSSAGKSFSESWKEHFALSIEAANGPELIEPSAETILDVSVQRHRGDWLFRGEDPGDLLEDTYYDESVFEPGVIYAAIRTRQGGGNRDCYCEGSIDDEHEAGCIAVNNDLLTEHKGYLFDFDDSFDSTYATFVFRTDLTPEDVEELDELRRHIHRIGSENSLIGQINSGAIAPWVILGTGTPKDLSAELATARRQLSSTSYSFNADTLKLSESLISVADRLIAGEVISEEEIQSTFGAPARNEIQRRLKTQDWSASQILDRIQSTAKKIETLAHMRGMMEEAEALPADSKLAKYLLGDRGQGSYTTQEKQGRRKVTVRKVYDRGSKLGEKIKSAERSVESELKWLQESLGGVREIFSSQSEAAVKISELELQIAELEKLNWAAGWPGGLDELPARPMADEKANDDSGWDA